MNLSRFFIDRPIFAGVISVIIFLAGIVSLFELPISEYPEVVPPTVVVKARFPGANPKVIAETVASPGIGPAWARPSGWAATRVGSLDWNAARWVTSRVEPSE